MMSGHFILPILQVLASLDILGDPARLVNGLGLGFWHLITLPAIGARKGPGKVAQTFAQGVNVIAYSICNSLAKYARQAQIALNPFAPQSVRLIDSSPQGADMGRDLLQVLVGGYAGTVVYTAGYLKAGLIMN